MLFPYMGAYSYLMGLHNRTPDDPGADTGGAYGMRPWDLDQPDRSTGFHGTGTPSFTPDPAVKRQALGAGLTAFGGSLLEAAGRGDWAGGLGRGAQAFSQAYGGTMDQERQHAAQEAQLKREQAADEREAQAAEDRHLAAQQGYDQSGTKFGAWTQEQKDAAEARTAKAAAAQHMVVNIQGLAAKSPNDAKLQAMAERAAAYDLNDDSDLDKLGTLHEQMTGQAFHGQDEKQKLDEEITRLHEEIRAGVRSDPKVEERQRGRQLDISAGHLALSKEAAQDRGRGVYNIPPGQIYRSIEKKAQTKLQEKIKARSSFRPPTPAERTEMWNQALQEAISETQSQSRAALKYTRDGRLVPDTGDPDFGDVR